MADVLADLLVMLRADSAELRTEIQKSREQLTGFASTVETTQKVIAGLFAFEEIKQTAEALYEFVARGAEAAQRMTNLSMMLGVSVEEMSRLNFVAVQSGMDQESMARSMERLSKNMEQATTGTGKAAVAFNALGIGFQTSTGELRPVTDVFADIADKFSRMQDGSTKTALAMMLFGRAGAEMIPMLNRGSQGIKEAAAAAEQYNAFVSNEVAAGATQLNQDLQKFSLAAKVLAMQIAADLAPAVHGLVAAFSEAGGAGSAFKSIAQGVAEVVKFIAALGVSAAWGIKELSLELTNAWKSVTGFAGTAMTVGGLVRAGHYKEANEIAAKWKADSDDRQKIYEEEIKRNAQRASDAVTALGFPSWAVVPPTLGVGVKPLPFETSGGGGLETGPNVGATEAQHKAVEDLQKALASLQRQQAGAEGKLLGLEGMDPEVRAITEAFNQYGDKVRAAGAGNKEAQETFWNIIDALKVQHEEQAKTETIKKGEEATRAFNAELAKQATALAKTTINTHEAQVEQDLLTGKLGQEIQAIAAADLARGVSSETIKAHTDRLREDALAAAHAADVDANRTGLMNAFNTELQANIKAGAAHLENQEEQRMAYELAYGDLSKYITGLERGTAAEKAQAAGLRELLMEEARQADFLRSANAGQQFAKSAWEGSEYGREDLKKRQLDEIDDALAAGKITWDQWNVARQKAEDDYVAAGGKMSKTTKALTDNMTDAFAKNVFQGFDKGVKAMVQSFIQGLEEMAAKALMTNLLGMLGLGAEGGAATGGLNWLTGMMGFRQGGGDILSSRPYMVGEHGPELIVPSHSGTVLSTRDTMAAMMRPPKPPVVQLAIHPDALHMTLNDWLQGELARTAARR